ncbi:MAG: hypothetical protein C4524_13380 [Candidatus Zixiibacteriota bacterium]|nr:MAG: hypothetical protein C4524_13380 [candidate division Zixibacteria bacterium]
MFSLAAAVLSLWLIFTGSPILPVSHRPAGRPVILEGGWWRVAGITLLAASMADLLKASLELRLALLLAAGGVFALALVRSFLDR